MSLAVEIEKRLGDFRLAASFDAPARVTALFGPSGAGKTTLADLIAGLARPDRGRILLDGVPVFDAGAGIDLPARRRNIGYVFQDGRLFPHLSVRQNLLYGRWLTRRRERWGSLADIVEILGIGHLLDRRPGALSGGEARRVAIGRAILASPRLLILDEPLAGLDEARRGDILPYLERLRDEMALPQVLVSHDMEDVVRLADTLVLLAAGRVVAAGPLDALLGRLDLVPYTGRLEASTVLSAKVAAHDPATGLTALDHPAGRLLVPLLPKPIGEGVRLRLRARDVSLAVGPVGRLSIRNRLACRVAEIAERDPPVVEVRLDAAGDPVIARLTRDALAELGLAPGVAVTALIKSVAFDRS